MLQPLRSSVRPNSAPRASSLTRKTNLSGSSSTSGPAPNSSVRSVRHRLTRSVGLCERRARPRRTTSGDVRRGGRASAGTCEKADARIRTGGNRPRRERCSRQFLPATGAHRNDFGVNLRIRGAAPPMDHRRHGPAVRRLPAARSRGAHAVSDRARPLRNVPGARRWAARGGVVTGVRRAGVSQLSAVRLAGRRLRAVRGAGPSAWWRSRARDAASVRAAVAVAWSSARRI